MKQIIELRDTEKRKMIAETFGISLANLSQILRFKRNGKNAEAIRTKQYGIKTVEEWGYVPYVMGYDLKAEYSLVEVFVHKCKKCRKRMHKATDEELQTLPCPKCGTENATSGLLMWD